MSIESINQFLQEVGQDPAIQQQLQSATDRPSLVNKVLELGKQKGYSFSTSDVERSIDSLTAQMQSQTGSNQQLSEEELEAVAGGFCTPAIIPAIIPAVTTVTTVQTSDAACS